MYRSLVHHLVHDNLSTEPKAHRDTKRKILALTHQCVAERPVNWAGRLTCGPVRRSLARTRTRGILHTEAVKNFRNS